MIEYTPDIDKIFETLADDTRRDILLRVSESELNISEIALFYDISFAAVAKHIKIMEEAGMIIKRKDGKKRYVSMAPGSIDVVREFINQFDDALLNNKLVV